MSAPSEIVRAGRRAAGPDPAAALGGAMIVGTSASVQISAALAGDLFQTLGPTGASALRFALGAVILTGVVRPRVRGRNGDAWRVIARYGVSLAALNVTFFEAIERLPLGVAVTFAFLAPLAMAIVGSRRRRDVAFAALAGAGVLMLAGFGSVDSIAGTAFALASGAAWASVAYAGQAVGTRTARLDGLALALPIAAGVTLPFGVVHLGDLDPGVLGLGLLIATGGLILPFALELEGLRRLEPRTVAVVYSLDPAIAALVGFVGLGQALTSAQLLGIAAVTIASLGAVWGSGVRSA